jgi:tankyrase
MSQAEPTAPGLRLDDYELLVRKGKNLDGALSDVCTARNPDPQVQVSIIRFLIKHGASISETDKNGVTPLHHAVRFRSPAAVKELIARGADVNAVDKKTKSTPLHRAVTNTGAPNTANKSTAAMEIAELLLANGANPRIKNKMDKTPLDYVKNDAMKAVFAKHALRTK